MKSALKAMLQDLHTFNEVSASENRKLFHTQIQMMLTSTGSCFLAPSLRGVNGKVLLCSSSFIACLFGEHSRRGENSENTTVTTRTAKMTVGHFRLVG